MKRISVSLTTLLATLAVSSFSHAYENVKGKISMIAYKGETTILTVLNERATSQRDRVVQCDIVDGKTPQTIKDTLLHPELLGKRVAIIYEDHVVESETRKVIIGLVRKAGW
ncbi:hypothetical protein [Vibrio caribbeanicus]|uniref:hypothetical protein n=1 Tax=Vibrio caribbeanicus TaxID=701175 RepID=UPI0030D7D2B9